MESLLNEADIKLEYEIKHLEKTTKCGICGENHPPTDCDFLTISNHIPDKVIPSRARLSLPESLEIRKLSDGSYNVYAQCLIEAGTQFGPFQAKKLFTLYPSIEFPLKVFTEGDEDLSEYFLDTSDENECSWMMFVSPANDIEEQNLVCYQEGEHLYYATLNAIKPAESLKVWYSPYYAAKMKKALLGSDTCIENNFEIKPDIEALLKQKKNITARDSWSCKFCGKVEKELSVFSVHLLEHYRAQLRKSCGICNDNFLSKQLLNKHLRVVHGNSPNSLGDSSKNAQVSILKLKDENFVKETSVGGPLLLSDITPDSMDNSNLLLPQTDLSQFDLTGIENQNMLLENENIDNILNENVKQLDHFNFEINIQESEQLICDICLKHFVKLKLLIQHLEQHTGKFFCHECNRVFARKENLSNHACKLYYKIKCTLCDRIFFQKKFLTHHIKAFHNKQYTCENCNKFYHSKRGLDTHNCPNVPTSKKEKFVCKICHKIFFKKLYLQNHMNCHNRDKTESYICAICNKTLTSRKTYVRHLNLHDKPNYDCDICQRHFHRSDNLKAHKEEYHTNFLQTFVCAICDKLLKSKRLLQAHMNIHKKEKPYKCEICNAKFKQRTNLSRHLNTHKSNKDRSLNLLKDGIKFYNCPKCDKKMTLRSSLSRHMKKFHPEYEMLCAKTKPKLAKLNTDKSTGERSLIENDDLVDDDESVMDLKQTIENMNFNTDEMNNCSESNEINLELEKILNNDNIDNLLGDSNDRIVENLISIAAEDNRLNVVVPNQNPSKEVCLSMPDLSEGDQEIKLGENAYLLDNGNIVEEQDNSKVVVYVLDGNKFT